MGLFGVGCVTFSVYVGGLVCSPLGFPKAFWVHGREVAALGQFGLGCVTLSVHGLGLVLCLRTGACLFSFRGSKGAISARCGGRFFASSEAGFRWCLAVLSPSPRGCRLGFVRARLRDVFCLRTGACLFSFRGSKAAFRHAAEDGFLLRLRPDLGGVWLF